MQLSDVLKQLALEEKVAFSLRPAWTTAMQQLPKNDDDIPFLNRDIVLNGRELCQISSDVDQALISTISKVKADDALRAYAWYCFYALFRSEMACNPGQWPEMNHRLGDDEGCLYLLLTLAMVPEGYRAYQSKQIPDDIIKNSLLEIHGFNGNHMAVHQVPGILKQQLTWLRNYQFGRIFRLNRLEFKLEPYGFPGRVLKHKENKQLLVLAPDGMTFNSEGLVDGVRDNHDPDAWTASYELTETAIKGYPVAPTGHAQKERVSLSRQDWEELLVPGHWILDLHIPPGGGLTPEACLKSFEMAAEFFPKYFPDSQAEAIVCCSWIFDPTFDAQLPESNLAKLQRELYIYPWESTGEDAVFFVFGQHYKDLKNPPRQTSLQKLVLDTLDAGKALHASCMVLLLDDLKQFGSQHYRKQWQVIKEQVIDQ